MNDGLLNKKAENSKIAEKYVNKYISDLQLHMSLSDNQIVQILNNCIQSFKNRNKNNGNNTEKKWWQILKKNITIKDINIIK